MGREALAPRGQRAVIPRLLFGLRGERRTLQKAKSQVWVSLLQILPNYKRLYNMCNRSEV